MTLRQRFLARLQPEGNNQAEVFIRTISESGAESEAAVRKRGTSGKGKRDAPFMKCRLTKIRLTHGLWDIQGREGGGRVQRLADKENTRQILNKVFYSSWPLHLFGPRLVNSRKMDQTEGNQKKKGEVRGRKV